MHGGTILTTCGGDKALVPAEMGCFAISSARDRAASNSSGVLRFESRQSSVSGGA